jgi:eukaryotic-like serine/threonine-protein kinase
MSNHADRVGQELGDYRLLRWLGGGGFGDVYLGEHRYEHTQVAVKVLQARLTRSADLKEFINEARTIRLNHPHILPLLDFGVGSDETPYLVIAYAPHGTLRDRHPKGSQLPLSTIVSYVTPLASALHYAHMRHLIHRDVKPENMLVGAKGEILLSDFGIATVAHSSRSLSTEQRVGGTLPYMAPEQIQSKPRAASDQYALGIVVYEWLTGRRPFSGTVVELAVQHVMTPPSPFQEQFPALPKDVEQVVLRALAKDPKQRFATVEEFAQVLEQASQQTQMPKSSAERIPFVVSPPPPPTSVPVYHPKDQMSRVDPEATEALPSDMSAVSLPEVEEGSLNPPSDAGVLPSPASHPPSHGSPQELHRHRSRNYVRISLIAMALFVVVFLIIGLTFLIIGLPLDYMANQAKTQARSTATAVAANATTAAQSTATQHAMARATAGVALTAVSGVPLLQDPLSSNINGRWKENSSCVFSGQSYHVEVQQPNFLQICPANTFPITNDTISVDVSLLSSDNAGLLFRTSGQQFYDFEITALREFFFRMHNPASGSNYTYIINNTRNNAIVPGGKNTLLVIASGDDFKFFINGTFVDEQHEGTLASGQLALAAGTLTSTSSGEASFTNLQVFKF